MTGCYSHRPGAVALSLTEKKDKILSAHDHVGRRLVLEDEFIDLVIQALKNLWPECQMVRGSPR